MIGAIMAACVGVMATVASAYAALVVILIATVGMPLGAERTPPGAIEYGVLLLATGGSAAIGSRATTRIARQRRGLAVALLALTLPVLAVWAFFRSPGWPAWWGSALAAALLGGVLASGGRFLVARNQRGAD